MEKFPVPQPASSTRMPGAGVKRENAHSVSRASTRAPFCVLYQASYSGAFLSKSAMKVLSFVQVICSLHYPAALAVCQRGGD